MMQRQVKTLARYKKHVIRYGETVQSIAALEMGDVSGWTEIVKYNKLHYPYIAETDEEKIKDVDHLVTIGDSLVIPIEVELANTVVDNMTARDKEEISKLTLGVDLSMLNYPEYYQDRGTQDEIFALSSRTGATTGHRNKRDLALVEGKENVKQVIMAKLMTPKGALILHPEYGSHLHEMFLKSSIATKEMIDDEISATIQTDTRVDNVRCLSSKIEGNVYSSSWTVSLISIKDQFDLLIEGDETGEFTIQ